MPRATSSERDAAPWLGPTSGGPKRARGIGRRLRREASFVREVGVCQVRRWRWANWDRRQGANLHTARQNFYPLFSARALNNVNISAKETMAGALLGPDVELVSVQLPAAWMAASLSCPMPRATGSDMPRATGSDMPRATGSEMPPPTSSERGAAPWLGPTSGGPKRARGIGGRLRREASFAREVGVCQVLRRRWENC